MKIRLILLSLRDCVVIVMPAKAGIQDFKYLSKIKNWIPAFAGMTPLFSNYDTVY